MSFHPYLSTPQSNIKWGPKLTWTTNQTILPSVMADLLLFSKLILDPTLVLCLIPFIDNIIHGRPQTMGIVLSFGFHVCDQGLYLIIPQLQAVFFHNFLNLSRTPSKYNAIRKIFDIFCLL